MSLSITNRYYKKNLLAISDKKVFVCIDNVYYPFTLAM